MCGDAGGIEGPDLVRAVPRWPAGRAGLARSTNRACCRWRVRLTTCLWKCCVARPDLVALVVGLTKVTALENATSGVTCNAICPGWVLTPLVQKQVDARAEAAKVSTEEAKRQLLGEKEPSMQFTTPEELGQLAVFFCSPAGNNVRGVAWNMDGGWAAQ